MAFGKITTRDISWIETFLMFIVGGISVVTTYKGGYIYHLALDSGDYVGAAIGLFVIICPMLVCGMIGGLVVTTDKLCIAIKGDDE